MSEEVAWQMGLRHRKFDHNLGPWLGLETLRPIYNNVAKS